MSIRTWIFAALVALGMALNLGLVSLRIAQTGEETVRARVAAASVALKAQLDLLDARLSPKAVAANPDLIEATRLPGDPTQPLAKPDDRALRAAASVVAPEPDLLIVATGQGAIVSRRGKPAASVDDITALPLAKAALSGTPAPSFVAYDGALFRVSAARIPGNAAAVIVGMLVDDRLASQLRSQVDADVSLLQGDKLFASSLPVQGESRAQLQRWVKAPAPGFGVLQVRLPVLGSALSGTLPRGSSRWATRGALVALDSGMQAALTVPASAYLGWLGRYQAFYLVALVLLALLGFIWGLVSPRPKAATHTHEHPAPQRRTPVPPPSLDRSEPSLLGADVSPNTTPPKPVPLADVPWSSPPEEGKRESAAPSGPAASDQPKLDPIWHGDSFSPTAGQFLVPALEPEQASEVEATAPRPKDFSFAGLLDEAHAVKLPQEPGQSPAPSQDFADKFAGFESPSETPFPGDEPTRIEPVSAALIDKLRERDDELAAAADLELNNAERIAVDHAAAESAAVESAAADGSAQDHSETQPTEAEEAALEEAAAAHSAADRADAEVASAERLANEVADQDAADRAAAPAPEPEADSDEQHWLETFDKFRELKAQLGEPVDRISFEKFAAKLRKNRLDLLARHSCKGVRFSVYEKDGRAAIKASAIR